MTNKVTRLNSSSTESIWNAVKNTVRNVDMPEVITLDNNSRVVYYPPDTLTNEAGYKNQNAQEYTLVSPSGAKVIVQNLNAFCKDVFGVNPSGKGMYTSSFSNLVNGVRGVDNVLGWTSYKEESNIVTLDNQYNTLSELVS